MKASPDSRLDYFLKSLSNRAMMDGAGLPGGADADRGAARTYPFRGCSRPGSALKDRGSMSASANPAKQEWGRLCQGIASLTQREIKSSSSGVCTLGYYFGS